MDQTDTQVVAAIKGLLEWTFQVEIPDQVMGWVVDQIRLTWNDGDPSEQQLIAYLVQLAVQLAGTPEPAQAAARPQVVEILQAEFGRMELNDRGRTLVALRGILETLRPGCTHKLANLAASTGLTMPGAATFGSFGATAGGAGGPGLPNFNALVGAPQAGAAAPAPAPAAAPAAAPAPAAAGGAPPMPGVDGMLNQQMEAQRNQQLMMMQSNMQKMHHDTMMSIIKNMG